MSYCNNKTLIFIVSSGRSGTTLLRSILNATEQIFIPHESDFIGRAYRFYHDREKFDALDYRKIVKLFQNTSKTGWGMTEEYLLFHLNKNSPQTFADVNWIIYKAYHSLEKTQDLLWGIKSPVLICSIKEILEIFPHAKIIHIVRDGRDVCLSYQDIHKKNQVKFGPKSLIANAFFWVNGLRHIEEFSENQNIYELKYEDLLVNPEGQLNKLCHFLEINYQKSIIQNYQNNERNKKMLENNFMKQIHSKAQKTIDAKNMQKYCAQMNKKDRFIFELIASPYLEKYNYALEFAYLPTNLLKPFRQIAYFCARNFNNFRYKKRDIDIWKRVS